jgi:hypothetical protein
MAVQIVFQGKSNRRVSLKPMHMATADVKQPSAWDQLELTNTGTYLLEMILAVLVPLFTSFTLHSAPS